MNKTLHDRFEIALAEKKATVQRHESELKDLVKYHRMSKKFGILWDEKVTIKNAPKTLQLGSILLAFSKRLTACKAYEVLTDVKMSTYQLWTHSQHGSVSGKTGPSVNFRGYLHHLKSRELLNFDTKTNKWTLTEASITRIKGK